MSVLVEAISVIIKRSSIDEKWPGGLISFSKSVPNASFCRDRYLVRVGFMTPVDVEPYMNMLENGGLVYLNEKQEAIDILVAEQLSGISTECNWASFGYADYERNSSQRVAICSHVDDKKHITHTPMGWTYKNSLTSSFGFVPTEYTDRSLEFLRHENGLDVYFNKLTNKEVYIARVAQE